MNDCGNKGAISINYRLPVDSEYNPFKITLSVVFKICRLHPLQKSIFPPPPHKKGYLMYDTRLHLVVSLQLWNSGKYGDNSLLSLFPGHL